MAKKRRRTDANEKASEPAPVMAAGGDVGKGDNKAEDVLVDFAEDLGRLLGTAQAKASSWLDQRKSIADQLTQIRDTANDYLQRLSGRTGNEHGNGRRRGRPPGSGRRKSSYKAPAVAVRGKRKGGMTPEGRARVAAAQKARWAKIRAEKAKAARGAGK